MRIYNFENGESGEDKQDDIYMRHALSLAKQAFDEDEIPVGAVVVCQNKIIGKGYNLTETLKDVTAHAEMQAITAASNFLGGKYLLDCTLYVTLEPCIMCTGALAWSQISRVVYGAKDPRRPKDLPCLYHPKTKIEGDVLEKECRDLLTSFFRNKREF